MDSRGRSVPQPLELQGRLASVNRGSKKHTLNDGNEMRMFILCHYLHNQCLCTVSLSPGKLKVGWLHTLSSYSAFSGSSVPSIWPCNSIWGFRKVWLRLSCQNLKFSSLYTQALIARSGGRSREGIERREAKLAKCLHVWQVALWVISRRSELRRIPVKSMVSWGSFDRP